MGGITDFGGDIGLFQRKITEGLALESEQAFLDLGGGGGHLVRDILRWQLEIMAAPLLYRYYGIVDASREQIRAWIIECTKSFGLIAPPGAAN